MARGAQGPSADCLQSGRMSSRTISPSIPSALRMRTRTLRRDPKGRVSISVGDLGCHSAVGTHGQLRLGCGAPRELREVVPRVLLF